MKKINRKRKREREKVLSISDYSIKNNSNYDNYDNIKIKEALKCLKYFYKLTLFLRVMYPINCEQSVNNLKCAFCENHHYP